MVFAGFFISGARKLPVIVTGGPTLGPAVFVTGNFDVSGATLTYKDMLVVTPTEIEFKTDGTKLFVAIQGSSTIYEYSLSTAWDLSTISSDATTSLTVTNMDEVQSFDFSRTGKKLYACGSGNVAEFSMTTAYDLSTAGSQSTLDISAYSGTTNYGACFSNLNTSNYLHFTSSDTTNGNIHTIATLEIASPLSGSTLVGRSSNLLPLISNVVAPDLHTTRTLEVSGGGTRFYQIYRNTDLSNVYVVEFKLGTPHDASTLTSATQIEDYFDLATQTGGTALYDTFNSLKIKPDGSEMFLSGTNFWNTETHLGAGNASANWNTASRNMKYVVNRYYGGANYGRLRIYEYDEIARNYSQIKILGGNATYAFNTSGAVAITNDGNTMVIQNSSANYLIIAERSDPSTTTWTFTQKLSEIDTDIREIVFTNDGTMFFVPLSGYTSPVGRIGVYTKSGGSWSRTSLVELPSGSTDDGVGIDLSPDETRLFVGSVGGGVVSNIGVVYEYSNVAGTWTYTGDYIENQITGATDIGFAGRLGVRSAGSNTRVAVGAPKYSSNNGRVFIFDKLDGTWTQTAFIANPTSDSGLFGESIDIDYSGNNILIGAPQNNGDGVAYMYSYYGGTWTLTKTFGDTQTTDENGEYVFMSDDSGIVFVSETKSGSSQGVMHFYTSPKNTQTYSLDVPTPVLYISGEKSNTYDIWSTSSDVAATGTGDFITVDTISKVGSNCLTFDNSTTSVVVPNFPEANTLPMSVSFWYQKTNTNTEDVLLTTSNFNSGSGTTAGFSIHAQSTEGKYIEVECNSADYTRSSIECPNYQWHHVAITIDTAGTIEIYINGTRDTSTTASGWDLSSSNFASGQNIVLGDDPTSSSHFGGYMDDIKIFNAVLAEKTVKKIYLDGLAPAKTQAFHLTFEDNTGADILPSDASLGGTSLSTLQSTTVTFQGDYVGYFPGYPTLSNVQLQWSSYETPFTVSLWTYVLPYNATNPNTNIYRYQTVFAGYEFYGEGGVSYIIDDQGTGSDPYSVSLGFRGGGSSPPSVSTSADLYLGNRWVHHCVSFDGTNVKIYINGSEKASGTFSGVTMDPEQMLTFFGTIYRVDTYNQVDLRNYKGYADDIRVYDYVLDPQEVEYLYTSTIVHKDQSFYLSYDQSNVYDYYNGSSDVTATDSGEYNQDPGSKIGTHSGQYPQGITGTIVPTWTGLTTATELTFSVWVFPTDLTAQTYYTLFCTTTGYESGTTGISGVLVNSSGNLQLQVVTKASSTYRNRSVTLTSVSNFTNKWMHIGFVFTSTTGKIFVNGAEQTLSASGTWSFSGVPSGDDLRIGNYNDDTSQDYHGALDDLRIFTRDLNTQEIAGLYRQYTQSRIYAITAK